MIVTNVSTQEHKGSLRAHKQSKHEKIKYNCDKCHYKATTKQTLRIHKQSNHRGIKYV